MGNSTLIGSCERAGFVSFSEIDVRDLAGEDHQFAGPCLWDIFSSPITSIPSSSSIFLSTNNQFEHTTQSPHFSSVLNLLRYKEDRFLAPYLRSHLGARSDGRLLRFCREGCLWHRSSSSSPTRGRAANRMLDCGDFGKSFPHFCSRDQMRLRCNWHELRRIGCRSESSVPSTCGYGRQLRVLTSHESR